MNFNGNEEDSVQLGNYILTKDQITVRCGIETFMLVKGMKIKVEAIDIQHGDALIRYGDNLCAWKHISVLRDFKRMK